ncbi:hypothetical protein GQ44DRAFT_698987 [Phaeosphaeriaceae sp. PMI808]|nr:hypothetical protein GQ44DRAFT_698987 [Phaeosphaeriaceae sp. PMI808]
MFLGLLELYPLSSYPNPWTMMFFLQVLLKLDFPALLVYARAVSALLELTQSRVYSAGCF